MNNRIFLLTFFILSAFSLFGQSNTSVNLILNKTSEKIKTISFLNLGQSISFHEQPFRDSIRFEFVALTDDGYDIWYTSEERTFRSQVWLSNSAVIVYISISDVTLTIDSVIGAPVYYEVLSNFDSLKNIGEDKNRLDRFLMNKITTHFNSPYSIMLSDNYMGKFQNDKSKLRKLKIIMDMQSPGVKNHLLYEGAYQRLLALLGVQQLDFEQYTFFDKDLEETQFVNGGEQFTVLDFWFSGCKPCIKQHKEIKKDIEENASEDQMRIVGVSTDRSQSDWMAYLSENKLPWNNYLENDFIEPVLSKELGIKSFPTYVLIDENNKIIGNFNSYQNLKDFIQKSN